MMVAACHEPSTMLTQIFSPMPVVTMSSLATHGGRGWLAARGRAAPSPVAPSAPSAGVPPGASPAGSGARDGPGSSAARCSHATSSAQCASLASSLKLSPSCVRSAI